jgi:signal transduction histidine kinase
MEKVNILLVDDQPGKLLSYQAILADLDENLILARSGREALQCLLKQEFALILLDVIMPEMDGFETANLIRQHPRLKQTPIIFVTALSTSDLDRLKGYELGAVDYVFAPIVPEILRAKAAVFVELYRKRQELQGMNRALIATNAALVAEIAERKRIEAAVQEERASLARRVEERTAELREANEKLARAAHLKDEFLAGISHELRTPLNTILSVSEALQEQIYGLLNEKQHKALGNIEESGRHLLALINDILDLSKIGAGKLELEIAPVSVEEICQASLRFINYIAQRKQLKVFSSIDSAVTARQATRGDNPAERSDKPTFAPFRADARQLKQILVNLLSNAVKFTPEGGAIGLEVAGNIEEGAVHFTVWDNGIGIASENLEHLFQPFVQLDSSIARKYPGTGLGLALVHRLVDLHGGGISVESEPGKGSRFTVSLPWQASDPTERAETVEPAGPSPTGSLNGQITKLAAPNGAIASLNRKFEAASSPTDAAVRAAARGDKPAERPFRAFAPFRERPLILLAEDNESNVRIVSDYLSAKRYRVVVARNGSEAIALARKERPGVILMDIQMPGMDGLEAMRRIRAAAGLSKIPIIALTALAMRGDREKCLAAGANDYMSKPISLKKLVEMIETQYGKSQHFVSG